MENFTGKGKHIVKVGNNPYTNDIKTSKCEKRRILEMHLKLKGQQLKTILFIYRLLYQNFMVTAN